MNEAPTAALTHPRAWLLMRVVVGLQFVVAGVFSLLRWDATVAFNALAVGDAAGTLVTAVAVVLTIGGGALLTSGRRPRLAAGLLLAFVVPAAVRHVIAAAHVAELLPVAQGAIEPWAVELAGLARRGQLAAAVKNIALAGVLTFVFLSADQLNER